MKHNYIIRLALALCLTMSFGVSSFGQWSFSTLNQSQTIDFDNTVTGVMNGQFQGSGLTPTPSAGELDSDAWMFTGFSDGSSSFGGTHTSGDFARGTSAGGSSSGGAYGFETSTGNYALGIHPGGSDWTPGTLTLIVVNNTGSSATGFDIDYDILINNDQGRAGSFNFSYAVNSGATTAVSALDYTSTEAAQGSVLWDTINRTTSINVTLNDGDSLLLVWNGDDVSGSGSRDEFALDNIDLTLNGASSATNDLVITEIMYNNPSTDTFEFIELYNNGSAPIDLTGYSFTQGVTHTFASGTVPVGGYYVLTNDSLGFFNTFGFTAYPWTSGSLSNSGEDIIIVDASMNVVDSVEYDDAAPWPTEADGDGYSLTLANPSSDNSLSSSWCLSGDTVVGLVISGFPVVASPGASNSCFVAPPTPTVVPNYPIADINNTDVDGVADSLGVYCWTKGLVLGVNMSGSGLSFTIFDGEGMGVFNSSVVSGYTVTEGDSILIRGTVDQYNGLTQLGSIDSIQVLNQGNAIPTPAVVTALDESTESNLVRINNVAITAISGSNYTLVDGASNTYVMRVDSDTDVDDSLSLAIGDSLCYVIGIGGQFDSSNPYTEGYQIFPRYYTDLDTSCTQSGGNPTPTTTPFYPIADINNTDVDGVADSLNVYCWTKGLVLGVDMRGGNGIQFTIFDGGEGIGVFNFNDVSGYTVTEGDSIMIRGTVDQFNGLTQLGNIDSIMVVNQGNALPTPTVVTALGETTESALIKVDNVKIIGNSGSNYDILTAAGDTLVMRVDSDTDVDDSLALAVGDSLCYVIGIGGQFDSSNPYDDGYQIFPRYYTDLDTSCTQGGGNPTPIVINTYDIEVLRTDDADGVPDSVGVYCAIEGIVYGKDLSGGGFSFTIIDETDGINIYAPTEVSGYTVQEGDEIRAVGEVLFYNGLTELEVDSITVLSTGNCIPFPTIVSELDEDTESEYIELRNVYLADATQWPGVGFNANLDIVTENGDTLTMRIDKDSFIPDSAAAPTGNFNLVGIGGQFDSSVPHNEGYQIFPHYVKDLAPIGTINPPSGIQFNELMSSNSSTIQDGAGEYDDWFEIYNAGTVTRDLTGYFVTDGDDEPLQHRFERCNTDMTIAPGEYKIFWADNDLDQGVNHVGFALSSGGEYLGLYTPDGSTVVDSVYFPALNTDQSYGLNGNDKANGWMMFDTTDVTPGSANPLVTSIVEVAAQNNPLSVFPNPATGSMINFNKTISASVFNVQGQLIENITNANVLDVESFQSGIYIIKTNEGEIVKMIKK